MKRLNIEWRTVGRLLVVGLAVGVLGGCAMTAREPVAEAPAVESTQGVSAEPIFNNIRWATASEINNYGYDVFRGDAEEGPFAKLNESVIPGAGTTDEPQRYEYKDDSIAAGTQYYYYVESIALDGTREKFTPTFQSKAKYPDTP